MFIWSCISQHYSSIRSSCTHKMEKDVKTQLIKSVNAIKYKLKQMRENEDLRDLTINNMLKPVTEPLRILVKDHNENSKEPKIICNSNTSFQEFNESGKGDEEDNTLNSESFYEDANVSDNSNPDELEQYSVCKEDGSTSEYGDVLKKIYRQNNFHIPFGIRSENKKLMMGNSSVRLVKMENPVNNDRISMIVVNDEPYEMTPGLEELLLRKKPDLSLVSEKDKLVYKDILYTTNAHKRDYSPHGQFKGDRSIKYKCIIKPLFSTDTFSKGGSLPKFKKYRDNTDLVYWDDPNELIERLQLLIASRDAGNSNHDNEILAIIEELKEAGIIKE